MLNQSSATLDRRLAQLDRHSSRPFAGRMKLAAGSRSCQASARWSRQRSSPRSTTAGISGLGGELAAWIGLVPRQYTTGGKPRLGGIGRRANHYLRRQMIHGARSVDVAVGEARRPPFRMAEGARGEARLQSNGCRARQQDGEDRLGLAHAKGGLCGRMIAAHPARGQRPQFRCEVITDGSSARPAASKPDAP
jgi:hypothetical protein